MSFLVPQCGLVRSLFSRRHILQVTVPLGTLDAFVSTLSTHQLSPSLYRTKLRDEMPGEKCKIYEKSELSLQSDSQAGVITNQQPVFDLPHAVGQDQHLYIPYLSDLVKNVLQELYLARLCFAFAAFIPSNPPALYP